MNARKTIARCLTLLAYKFARIEGFKTRVGDENALRMDMGARAELLGKGGAA